MLPALLRACKDKLPGSYLHLYHFADQINKHKQFLQQAREALGIQTPHLTGAALLERELEIAPNEIAAHQLLNALARELHYALHELPLDVLYTTGEMEALLQEMSELQLHYTIDQVTWQRRLRYFSAAIALWKKYKGSKTKEGFEHFLQGEESDEASFYLSWQGPLYD